MDYGKLITRAVNIVWENKFLILLGILVALASGPLSSPSGGGGGDQNGNGQGQSWGEWGEIPEGGEAFLGLAAGLVLGLVCVGLIVGVALWVVSSVARGGLIAGVDTIESGGTSSFSQAWRAGWQKLWTLLGIGFLPALPGLVLFVVGLLAAVGYGGMSALAGGEWADPAGIAGWAIPLAALACLAVPVALALSILRNFAERACMLEDLGVVDAYRRGAAVLMANLGEAIILFLIQIASAIVLFAVLFVPGIIVVLCCLLWPLLLALQGAVSAVISAIWTLAWRDWTARPAQAAAAPR